MPRGRHRLRQGAAFKEYCIHAVPAVVMAAGSGFAGDGFDAFGEGPDEEAKSVPSTY